MYKTGAVLALDKQNVRLYCWLVLLLFDVVRGCNIILLYTALVMTALRWSSCLERVLCCVGLGQTVRTFIEVFSLNLTRDISIRYCIKSQSHFSNTLQWQWRLCVDLRLLNVWNGAVHEQNVRLYCCVCAWIRRCYWWWMRYEVILTCCSNTLQWQWRLCMRWFLFVKCMERVSCCPWANSAYVFIAACVLEFEGVAAFRCSMRS